VIEARGLVKSYGDLQVLRGVDLRVERGEIACVVGPNGAGKTTLLRILALLEWPDRGVVTYDGVQATRDNAASLRARIAYVPQRGHVLSLSVRNNVLFALLARGIPAEEASLRADEALRAAGLYGLRDKHAPALSGGQKQLLALARAFALQPEYLLLDEPTASLDPENVGRARKLLREYVRARRAAAVVVSHSMSEVRELADRTIVLVNGRVVAAYAGAPDDAALSRLFA
jgi:ABC-type multidrug transport system ATPase subunit